VMSGHLMRPPDLSSLPEDEQPAVARALAKPPKDRWPSCRAFVAALRLGAGVQIDGHRPDGVSSGETASTRISETPEIILPPDVSPQPSPSPARLVTDNSSEAVDRRPGLGHASTTQGDFEQVFGESTQEIHRAPQDLKV